MPRKPSARPGKRQHITLDDVARACGMSKMTVSRVLRDSDKVSPATREKVLEAARSMGYLRNRLAASFGAQESNIIGYVVPEVNHAFFPLTMMGAEPILNKRGYLLTLCCSYGRADKERDEVRALLEWRVDGIIIAPVSSTESAPTIHEIQAVNCPLVCLDRIVPDAPAMSVLSNHFEGSRAAVTHLVEEGYTRIAHLAGPENVWVADERLRGYRAGLADAGIQENPDYILHSKMSFEEGKANTERLLALSKPPDAIFASNDPLAAGALAVLSAQGLMVPEDIGVIGFGDVAHNEVLQPPLTSLSQEPKELGAICAEKLLAQIDGTATGPTAIMHQTRLLKRRSSMRR